MTPAAGLLAQARAVVANQRSLLLNAGAMSTGALATAALGFVYWWVAARFFDPREVGWCAAAVSVMTLIAQIGEAGLGPFLISHLPVRDGRRGELIGAALVVAAGGSGALAALFLLISRSFSIDLGSISATLPEAAVFVFGVALTSFVIVLDQAFVGLLRATTPMYRTIVFSGVKLALLILLALGSTRVVSASLIFDTWLAGQLVSLLLLAVVMHRKSEIAWNRPRVVELRPFVSMVLGHHAVNVGLQAPTLVLPFIVTILLAPQTNAAFYVAWTLVNAALLVPASLSAVLVNLGRREPAQLARRLKFSLAISAATGVATAVGGLVCSRWVLGLFNPSYPNIAGMSLAVLGFGTFGMIVKYHYIAVQRIEGRMVAAAALLAAGGLVEVATAVLGCVRGELAGFTLYWVIAVSLESAFMIRPIVRALFPKRPHELGEEAASSYRAVERFGAETAAIASNPKGYAACIVCVALMTAMVASAPTSVRAETAPPPQPRPGFVSVSGDHFVLDGRQFRVAGVNNHYLMFGSPAEVTRVLDDAVAMHVNVVRTFLQPVIGSLDGTMPTIWNWKSTSDSSNLGVHGNYVLSWDPAAASMAINDGPTGLQRLDFVLDEARKRNLKLIIALLDFWAYTGGAQQMSAWYGSHDKYTFFAQDDRTKRDYRDWVSHVITRVNSISGLAYRNDPTIFSWELMNEPDIHPRPLLEVVAERNGGLRQIA